MLKFLLPFILVPGLAFAQATDRPGASVMVAEVETGLILAANSIDDLVPANLAGRLAFALLVQEWIDLNQIDPQKALPGADQGVTIAQAAQLMLEDGRNGEMARASLAGYVGYTPQNLTAAMVALMQEMGVDARGLQVQRSAFGGPEWSGTLSVRDTGRIAISLTRIHSDSFTTFLSGAGLQCIGYEPNTKTNTPLVAVVSGAASPDGCLAAAKSSISLSDDRLDRNPKIEEKTLDSLPIPTQ
jgi:hypothetical protein